MIRLLSDADGEPVAEQDVLRTAFMEKATFLLEEFDSSQLDDSGDAGIVFGNHLMRVDGPARSWNRVTVYLADGSGPRLNVVVPGLLSRTLGPSTRVDAARAILSTAVAVSRTAESGEERRIVEVRERVSSAALAVAGATGRPVSAMMPTPWWPCMEHWMIRTSTDDGRPRDNPRDAFLTLVGRDLDHVVETLWSAPEDGMCPALVMTAAITGTRHAEESPIDTLRAIERWRPLMQEAGLA